MELRCYKEKLPTAYSLMLTALCFFAASLNLCPFELKVMLLWSYDVTKKKTPTAYSLMLTAL